ncbi:MAG: hypothetical protein AABZ53_09280 [Planctomycetota bacterium]
MTIRSLSIALVLIMLSFVSVLGGCDAEATDVRETDKAFDKALDSQSGAQAVTFLSKDSIARLDRMMALARTAKKAEVQALSFTDRLDVLQARMLFKAKELKTADGRLYFTRLVGSGWQGSTSDCTRVSISVNGEKSRATITYRIPRGKETFQGIWVKENGEWKSDVAAESDVGDRDAAERAKEIGMNMDQYLMYRLEEGSGGEAIPPTIWDPPR